MTAPGPVTALIVEVELTAGAWTDISSYVALESGVSIGVGRSNPTDDIAPSRCSLTLRNDDGRFTPNNVTSPLSPNWKRGKRVRVKVTKGSTVQRFVGTIVALAVIVPAGDMRTGQVAVTAVDGLAALGRRAMASTWADQMQAQALLSGVTADTYEFTGESGSAGFAGVDAASPAGVVIPSIFNPVATLAPQSLDGALFIPGMLSFTPVQFTNKFGSQDLTGPTARFRPRSTSNQQFGFWFRTSMNSADFPGGVGSGVVIANMQPTADGISTYPNREVLLFNTTTGPSLSVYFRTSGSFGPDVVIGTGYADGQWHSMVFFQSGANIQIYVDRVFKGQINTLTVASWKTVYFGAEILDFSTEGKQGAAFIGDISGVFFTGSTTGGSESYALPTRTASVFTRWNELGIYAGTALVPTSGAVTGSDSGRIVGYTATAGRSVLDVGQELARTVGGYVWTPPSTGNPTLVLPDALRLSTVAATVTLETDDTLAAPAQWVDAVDVNPTRVTASSSFGSATAVDSVAEAGGERRDATVDTCARSLTDAASIAAMVLGQSTILRVGNIGVDLASAATDLYAVFWALKPGDRIRVASLNTTTFGISFADGYLQSWTETYAVVDGRGSSMFVLDLSPADAPAEGTLDDAEYGRATTNSDVFASSGSAVGTTATGTVVLTLNTTTTGWSTSAGDYPSDIDWAGERCTINAAPSAPSAGTQTLTITTRGVAPTVARAHASNESVEVWHAAAATI